MAAFCAPAWDPANKWFRLPKALGLIEFSDPLSQHLDNMAYPNFFIIPTFAVNDILSDVYISEVGIIYVIILPMFLQN
ncbi:MAG: hypothetical protein ACTSW1_04670, partial [Candidatus Hodarchaeales archaeon]